MCRALPIGCAAYPRHRERRGDPAQLPARTPQVSTLRVSIPVCIACAPREFLFGTWIERVLVVGSSVATSPPSRGRYLYLSPPRSSRTRSNSWSGGARHYVEIELEREAGMDRPVHRFRVRQREKEQQQQCRFRTNDETMSVPNLGGRRAPLQGSLTFWPPSPQLSRLTDRDSARARWS